MKIFIAFTIGAIVGLGLSLFAFPARGLESALSLEGQFMDERKAILEARRADTYGGDTPQETLDLFIAALEKGDTDMAAKYFVVYKQEEMRGRFEAADDGYAQLILSDLSEIEGSTKYGVDKIEYYTLGKDGVIEFTYTLVHDPESNIWKLESL